MKNLFELIAKERNVELEEEFLLQDINDPTNCMKYKLTERGLFYFNNAKNAFVCSEFLDEFIIGKCNLIKLPFQPKQGEEYWIINFTHDNTPYVININWKGRSSDYEYKMLGIVFRTKEQAEAYIPTYLEKLKELGWKEND